MVRRAKRLVQRTLARLGYEIVRTPATSDVWPSDLPGEDFDTFQAVAPYTMAPPEAIYAICEAVRYIIGHGIPGDLVECGVWRGGGVMASARTLLRAGVTDRDIHLFDTFEGMTPPSDEDVDLRGVRATEWLTRSDRATSLNATRLVTEDIVWAYSPLDATRSAVLSIGYPPPRIHFVRGPVEATLPTHAPESIALLRLDTDWYESTRHELIHLFPRLSPGGVLIIDDYGHWQGARKATDEYVAANKLPLFLCRINYSTRVAVKWFSDGAGASADHSDGTGGAPTGAGA